MSKAPDLSFEEIEERVYVLSDAQFYSDENKVFMDFVEYTGSGNDFIFYFDPDIHYIHGFRSQGRTVIQAEIIAQGIDPLDDTPNLEVGARYLMKSKRSLDISQDNSQEKELTECSKCSKETSDSLENEFGEEYCSLNCLNEGYYE